MQIRPITTTKIQPVKMQSSQVAQIKQEQDSFAQTIFVDKKPLVDRKIIKPNQDINQFFDEISSQIFPDSNMNHSLSKLLQMGYVSLSSSAYSDLKNPKSAVALKLDEKKSPVQHCAMLEKYISEGVGVGLNFSKFKNPIEEIKYINNYFKYREPNLNRPPAGIALLSVTHPKIMEFISLKDNVNYQDWCFDLSVILDSEFLSKVENNQDLILDDGSKISAKNVYLKLLGSMNNTGEPGIIFSSNKDFLCDSCAAAELKENEGLNLAQINLSKFYNPKTKTFDYAFLSQSANTLSIALKRIAPNGFISVLGYQDLLNKIGLEYGSKEALDVLEKCFLTIKQQANTNDIRMCISPSGTISRILKTTPSIEPDKNSNVTYWDEIETLAVAQKYLDGGISKTINLKEKHTISDINLIVQECAKKGIKGVTVFKAR